MFGECLVFVVQTSGLDLDIGSSVVNELRILTAEQKIYRLDAHVFTIFKCF